VTKENENKQYFENFSLFLLQVKQNLYDSFAASCDDFDSLPVFKVFHKIFCFYFFFEGFFLFPSDDNLRSVVCERDYLPLETFNLPTIDHNRITNKEIRLGI